jgi:antitoxin MazE
MVVRRSVDRKFTGRIQAWGNSMGLRITQPLGELAGLGKGDAVTLEVTEDGLLIRRKTPLPRAWTEEELLAGLSPHQAHADELPELLSREQAD